MIVNDFCVSSLTTRRIYFELYDSHPQINDDFEKEQVINLKTKKNVIKTQ